MDGMASKLKERQRDGQTDGQTDIWTDEQTNKRTNGWRYRQTERDRSTHTQPFQYRIHSCLMCPLCKCRTLATGAGAGAGHAGISLGMKLSTENSMAIQISLISGRPANTA